MNFYNKNDYIYTQTKRLERDFRRLFRNGVRSHLTGMGAKIHIIQISDSSLLYEVDSTKNRHEVKREKIRKAIWYMFLHRTATRKELEKFFNYNTHLMALLNAIFGEKMSKIHRMPNRLLRLTLKGTRYYFSGLEKSPTDRELVSKHGGRFVLFSFYTLRDIKMEKIMALFEDCRRLGLQIIIDSGAFSVMKARRNKRIETRKSAAKKRSICIKEYSNFLLMVKEYILGYFSLDVENDLSATNHNLEYLDQTVGITPYPVWHPGMGWKELERLVLSCRYSLIGLGGTVFIKSMKKKRALFSEIFEKYGEQQPFHWLGGSSYLLHEYDFLSTDSTGYNVGRRFRRLIPMYRPQVGAPSYMTPLDCLIYNIKQMAKLEESFFEMQMEIPLPTSA